MPTQPTYLTPPEVAARLRLSRASVYRLIAKGTLPAYRFGDAIRVLASDVGDYVQEHYTGAAEARLADAVVKAKADDSYEGYLEALRSVEEAKRIVGVYEASGHVVRAAGPNSDSVNIEAILSDEFRRLGHPLPVAVGRAGMSGVGDLVRRLLRDKGITEYDAATYRKAVQQVLSDLQNPQRRT